MPTEPEAPEVTEIFDVPEAPPEKEKKANLVQTSVRLNAGSLASIRDIVETTHTPQSEVIRAALSLYRHAGALKPPYKLAVVDMSTSKPEGYYLVDKFVVNESD